MIAINYAHLQVQKWEVAVQMRLEVRIKPLPNGQLGSLKRSVDAESAAVRHISDGHDPKQECIVPLDGIIFYTEDEQHMSGSRRT